ncbi:molybdenum cofactor biosynthesis moeA family protein [Mycobacterium xenopi 3993]|nr:molybdenum cofactor biosynthesis moeA family protein [Mycobacterium xenopi 3993]
MAPRPVRVAIAEAQGLMCAEEVVTERPLPGFDQAAIDGYAVRSVDVLGVGNSDHAEDEAAAEVSLPVMGSIEAGARTAGRLQPRQAVRVQTGAPLPTLADAVLPVPWTDGGQSRVRVLRAVRSGAYVRRTGDDVQPGDVAVRAGTIIGPAQVGCWRRWPRAGPGASPSAAVGDGGRWRAGRRLTHARPRAGVRRQLLCPGGRGPRRRRGGEPHRHRQRRSQAAARCRGGPAQPG